MLGCEDHDRFDLEDIKRIYSIVETNRERSNILTWLKGRILIRGWNQYFDETEKWIKEQELLLKEINEII